MSTGVLVVGGLVLLAILVAAMLIVSSSTGSVGHTVTFMTLAKIMVGSAQILGQLDFTLSIQWPGIFGWLINLLQFMFSFDLLKILKLGCVMVRQMAGIELYHTFTPALRP